MPEGGGGIDFCPTKGKSFWLQEGDGAQKVAKQSNNGPFLGLFLHFNALVDFEQSNYKILLDRVGGLLLHKSPTWRGTWPLAFGEGWKLLSTLSL